MGDIIELYLKNSTSPPKFSDVSGEHLSIFLEQMFASMKQSTETVAFAQVLLSLSQIRGDFKEVLKNSFWGFVITVDLPIEARESGYKLLIDLHAMNVLDDLDYLSIEVQEIPDEQKPQILQGCIRYLKQSMQKLQNEEQVGQGLVKLKSGSTVEAIVMCKLYKQLADYAELSQRFSELMKVFEGGNKAKVGGDFAPPTIPETSAALAILEGEVEGNSAPMTIPETSAALTITETSAALTMGETSGNHQLASDPKGKAKVGGDFAPPTIPETSAALVIPEGEVEGDSAPMTIPETSSALTMGETSGNHQLASDPKGKGSQAAKKPDLKAKKSEAAKPRKYEWFTQEQATDIMKCVIEFPTQWTKVRDTKSFKDNINYNTVRFKDKWRTLATMANKPPDKRVFKNVVYSEEFINEVRRADIILKAAQAEKDAQRQKGKAAKECTLQHGAQTTSEDGGGIPCDTVRPSESVVHEDVQSSLTRVPLTLVTRSTLEVVVPDEVAVSKLISRNALAVISELSGATMTLVEDKMIRIAGTPEQAERAQSLLQGFILSTQVGGS